jgi:hypothetical protein
MAQSKTFTLIGRHGQSYESLMPGTLGGHRRNKLYGRLDCRAALHAIACGGYIKNRVFFIDEATAISWKVSQFVQVTERTGERTRS